MLVALAVAVTAAPSSCISAVAGSPPLPVPSLTPTCTLGRSTRIHEPAAGLVSESTGGMVSVVLKLDVNATVCALPVASTAPFTVTV